MTSSNDYHTNLAKLCQKLPTPRYLIQPLSAYEQHRARSLNGHKRGKIFFAHDRIGFFSVKSIADGLQQFRIQSSPLGLQPELIQRDQQPDIPLAGPEKHVQPGVFDYKELVGDGRPTIAEEITASQGMALNGEGSLCPDRTTDSLIAGYRFRKQQELNDGQIEFLDHIIQHRESIVKNRSLINLKADLFQLRCKVDRVNAHIATLQRKAKIDQFTKKQING